MSRQAEDLVVVDCNGAPLEVGAAVEGGNEITGEVRAFSPTPLGIVVVVEWPDAPLPEEFRTELRFMEEIPVLRCEAVVAV